MKVYTRFIIFSFIKSLLFVSAIFFSLVLILNILTEIEFFKGINVETYLPIYASFLNSPTLLFEMFPFVFLISTQVFFINLFNENQIQIFKYSGLKNSSILGIITTTSFVAGIFIILLFYGLSSNLKNISLIFCEGYYKQNLQNTFLFNKKSSYYNNFIFIHKYDEYAKDADFEILQMSTDEKNNSCVFIAKKNDKN